MMKNPLHSPKRLASTAALLSVSLGAAAAPIYNYNANLIALNNSGVSANAQFAYSPGANTLNVQVNASGLAAGQIHAMHIHGPLSGPMAETGTPVQATQPTLAKNDSNGDGFIELGEAAPAYGEVLVPLTNPPGGGEFSGPFQPTPNGTLNYNQTFNLGNSGIYNSSSVTGNPFTKSQLDPLNLNMREIVIHGLTVPDGIQGNMSGGPAYSAKLPVAAGVIQRASATAVPEPSDLAMLVLGIGLVGGVALARQRRYQGGINLG